MQIAIKESEGKMQTILQDQLKKNGEIRQINFQLISSHYCQSQMQSEKKEHKHIYS